VAEIPTTPEVAEFVANLLRGTRAGVIEWKKGKQREFVADIGNDYQVLLQEIPDVDGQTNDPDHAISLAVNDRRLFTLNRLDLSAEELHGALHEPVEYSYQVFRELWDRAFLNATRLDEHLSTVNRALGQQIKAKAERRSPPPEQ
jgi:hypothetical protein